MLASTCVAAKCVGQLAQSAGLTDNNFRVADFCVDNCPVVPELCPELSTAASHAAVRCSPWAGRHNKKTRRSVKNAGLAGVRLSACQPGRGALFGRSGGRTAFAPAHAAVVVAVTVAALATPHATHGVAPVGLGLSLIHI